MSEREHTARTPDGLRLSYRVFGRKGDPPLMLLPGITMPAQGMAFLARRLCENRLVVVPDLRGRGTSDRAAPGHYRLADYAADVGTVLTDLAVDPRDVILIGHSLGARIAAYTATSGTDVRALVLVDPPMSRPGRPYPTSWEDFRAQLDPDGEGADLAEVQRRYPRWPRAEQLLRLELAPTCDLDAVRETWENFERDDFRPLWSALAPPTLLVVGDDSPVVLSADLTDLRQLRPDLPVTRIPGAGHMVPWDALDDFLNAVVPFLAEWHSETRR